MCHNYIGSDTHAHVVSTHDGWSFFFNRCVLPHVSCYCMLYAFFVWWTRRRRKKNICRSWYNLHAMEKIRYSLPCADCHLCVALFYFLVNTVYSVQRTPFVCTYFLFPVLSAVLCSQHILVDVISLQSRHFWNNTKKIITFFCCCWCAKGNGMKKKKTQTPKCTATGEHRKILHLHSYKMHDAWCRPRTHKHTEAYTHLVLDDV